jgi:hypothetical protein
VYKRNRKNNNKKENTHTCSTQQQHSTITLPAHFFFLIFRADNESRAESWASRNKGSRMHRHAVLLDSRRRYISPDTSSQQTIDWLLKLETKQKTAMLLLLLLLLLASRASFSFLNREGRSAKRDKSWDNDHQIIWTVGEKERENDEPSL